MKHNIVIQKGDITKVCVDVIANAANSQLCGGGGVDGAIHRAAGPQLLEYLKDRFNGCPTGSAVLTPAFNLNAKYIAHAVGPVWRGGGNGEPRLLASAYHTSLSLADDYHCHAIAFPAISAGVYGYPLPQAAEIALSTAIHFLQTAKHLKRILFILFNDTALNTFQSVYNQYYDTSFPQ